MKTEHTTWTPEHGWNGTLGEALGTCAQVVLVFGGREVLTQQLEEICAAYPAARILGCSTAGEISGTRVLDDSVVVTAVAFEHTEVECVSARVGPHQDSFSAGVRLAEEIRRPDLVHAFVLSDGIEINGSELVRGLTSSLPADVSLTGGLSGDGSKFERTVVIANGQIETSAVAVLGLYGSQLRIGYGSLGGWDPFGPERLVTRSAGNVLFELEGRSALRLYERYLGEHAKDLPASGLLFPLSIRTESSSAPLVRTILSIDREAQSITFAGDLPEGAYARFMKANFDRLIDGAVGAARASVEPLDACPPELALLISCVGRRQILQQRTEEEVEGVREVLGERPLLTGFYSYGEISPFSRNASCELHNQTMTITTLSEV